MAAWQGCRAPTAGPRQLRDRACGVWAQAANHAMPGQPAPGLLSSDHLWPSIREGQPRISITPHPSIDGIPTRTGRRADTLGCLSDTLYYCLLRSGLSRQLWNSFRFQVYPEESSDRPRSGMTPISSAPHGHTDSLHPPSSLLIITEYTVFCPMMTNSRHERGSNDFYFWLLQAHPASGPD